VSREDTAKHPSFLCDVEWKTDDFECVGSINYRLACQLPDMEVTAVCWQSDVRKDQCDCAQHSRRKVTPQDAATALETALRRARAMAMARSTA
jgi:hypothetical protein